MPAKLKGIEIHRPVVWVTGASRGIGCEIAKQFAYAGCTVALSARSVRNLNFLQKEISHYGGNSAVFPCDVSETKAVLHTERAIRRRLGAVEVLINNAGISVFKSFLNTSLEEFDDTIDTNLEGHIACIKSVLPSMIKQKRGWIFNIISNAAIKTFEGSSAYTATKAGMLGFGRVLREELRAYNIKIVNVIPGAVDTAMWTPRLRRRYSSQMMRAKSVAEVVLSIFRMPDDVVVDEIVIRPMKGDID